jgi:glycosyltransferase involved in cell wall biosynthesis
MNLAIITPSVFSENQLQIIKRLNKEINVLYCVLVPNKNSNFSDNELSAFCENNKIKYSTFVLKYRFRNPRLFKTYINIFSIVKTHKPDIILIVNFNDLYFNMSMAFLPPSKTIVAIHDVVNHSGTAFNAIGNLSKQILIKRFRHFLVYSATQAGFLQNRIPTKTITTIPLPLIDFGEIYFHKNEIKKKVTFLFFGNINSYKGLDILLNATNKLFERNKNFNLVIAGRCMTWEADYKNKIIYPEYIKMHIRFIDNSEIANFFNNADYLILPYRDVTQSGPLMIAYNYNLPVLSSFAIGKSELFSNSITGYTFNLEDIDDIIRVLEEAVNRSKYEYEQLLIRLTTWTSQHFNMNNIITKYLLMFNSINNAV